MKKQGILGNALSEVIASMGHTDLLVISDAGFPTPPGVQRIDLAVRCGLPSMLEVTQAIAGDLEVEAVTIANELLARDDALPAALRDLFPNAPLHHVSHEEFKRLSQRARAVVRTGECTPYYNVILTSGVTY
ncbi:MAG TPA: D-ribose pyranase [Gemmatimonadales bacterium]|nr:D-ribose pyranase [Gemmatimonadales bacterium]